MRTVEQLAKVSDVDVRALHHCHAIEGGLATTVRNYARTQLD